MNSIGAFRTCSMPSLVECRVTPTLLFEDTRTKAGMATGFRTPQETRTTQLAQGNTGYNKLCRQATAEVYVALPASTVVLG